MAPCIIVACLIALTTAASAHETRTEGGVRTVVGWTTEPAFVGYPNAAGIALSDSAGRPVTDLGPDDLKVEITFGGQKSAPLPLGAVFGTPGQYSADVIPTRGGEYTFRLFGTINGEPFDQSYTSGEETFDSPRHPADVSFPAKDPTAGELAASIERLSNEDASGSDSDSSGKIALGLGGLALLVALAAFFKKSTTA